MFALKQRPADQPLPLIAANIEQVADHVGTMTPLAERLAARGWPGPLTLIIPASPRLCAMCTARRARWRCACRAIRVARALAAAAGHAITSTSANLSGRAALLDAGAGGGAFGDGIDVLIDAGATPGGLPSTIVDATGDAPVLVRAGAIAWDRVLEFLD